MFHVCFFSFQIYLKTLKENLSLLTAEGEDEEEEALTDVKDSLNDMIGLCHQSSPSLNQQQREVCVRQVGTVSPSWVDPRLRLCPHRSSGSPCWRP